MFQWLFHTMGLDNIDGAWYAFWSGIGSDIQEVALLGGVAALLRHWNCHVHGCWRHGRFQVGDFRVCMLHHPEDRITAEHVAASISDSSTRQ